LSTTGQRVTRNPVQRVQALDQLGELAIGAHEGHDDVDRWAAHGDATSRRVLVGLTGAS